MSKRKTTLTEHQEQVALFKWAHYAQAAMPELRLLHAMPNGGHRNKITAAKLKAEGVKPGVPDICLPVARGKYHGLYIELKTRQGKLSSRQQTWLADLNGQGFKALLCWSWTSARQEIEHYLTLTSGKNHE